MPILEGTDGVQKMSKSLGNYIGIAEPPAEMFGKLMSISDDLMWRYLDLLSLRPGMQLAAWREEVAGGLNPMEIKFRLAGEVVERFHSAADAAQAREAFVARFRRGDVPDDMPEVVLASPGGLPVANLLKDAGLVGSTSEALRMIAQGAVRIDGERIEDKGLRLPSGTRAVVQVGKRRFARVTLN
jgi:tyrosyl-tRNA synthetase